MKIRIDYLLIVYSCLFIVVIELFSCAVIPKKETSQKLYQSSFFTPVKSFISPEGPAVDKAGTLYVVNYSHKGTIGKILPNGECKVFIELPDRSVGNGIRFSSSGDMFIADYINHNILKVDMKSKVISVFAHESKMSQPNDIAIDRKDRLYASDPDWKTSTGKIWRIDPNGKVILLDSALGTANGIEVSADDKILYVNETVQRKVWAYDLSASGEISNKRLLIEFSDFGMDGMRCDVKGNLYITRHGKGTVVKVSPAGKVVEEIILIGKTPTNLAFGGKDGRTVYVTVKDNENIESFLNDEPGREWKMFKNN
ncbi:MAG TPA: SMP-30/gluconolactonase/LRE family protein [Chitinophagaceae bacterium]|nr:SMP-30/gluconolactonase/LRE family protein [Chitinophagaceae bacterium]